MSGSSRSRVALTERRSRVIIAEAVPLLTRVPLYLSRVGRAGMEVETGPIYNPGETE